MTTPPTPITIPTSNSNFWISDENKAAMDRIDARSQKGQNMNILICGPKGCGKTTMVREFAARRNRPFFEIHCGTCLDAEQWFGKDRLTQNQTLYQKARFIEALETPNTVILLDELNRSHPEVLGAILGLLDWRRSIWNDDLGYQVHVAPGVCFFATINEGEDYFGTNPLDAALRDRFSRILEAGYPPFESEIQLLIHTGISQEWAEKLTAYANTLRKAHMPIAISTRQLIAAGEELSDGASLRQALETTLLNGLLDPSQRKLALEALQWLETNPFTSNLTTLPL